MKTVQNLTVLLAIMFAGSAATAGDRRPVVAVFDINAQRIKLKKSLLHALSDHLANQMAATGYYQVVPRTELKKRLLGQKKKSYRQCYDQACQIELGREMAAQKTLSAQVIKLGGKCTLNIELYDLRKAATEEAASARGNCDESGLVESIEKAVSNLTAGRRKAEQEKKAEAARKDEQERKAREEQDRRAREAEAARKAEQDGIARQAAEAERKERERRTRLEVKQPGTRLYWLRCPLGQEFSGYVCSGQPALLNFHAAKNACPKGYRLPTRREYAALLGGCNNEAHKGMIFRCASACQNSSNCSSMFTDHAGEFWSASPSSSYPNLTWTVNFERANNAADDRSHKYRVRCVRQE